MLLFQLISQASGDLGTFGAPSEAFAPEITKDGIAAANTLERLASVALGGATLVAGLYFLITFAIAALNWMGAGDDSGKVTKARGTMTNALVGLIIVIATYAVVGLIGSLIGLDILSPGKMLLELSPTRTSSFTTSYTTISKNIKIFNKLC
jgi:Flp pilus assembly protein protease CpaA